MNTIIKIMRFLLIFGIIERSNSQIAAGNLDRFNYRETVNGNEYSDFGPRDWIRVRCQTLGQCVSERSSRT